MPCTVRLREREGWETKGDFPPVSSTFIVPALPHLLPFRPFLRPSLSILLSLSRLASQHTLSPIMPVSLRLLSSHSLRLSATLTTEQPQESMHPGSLLPAANDPTFQAFSFSLSPSSSFSLPVSISLSLPLPRSLLHFPSLSLFLLLCVSLSIYYPSFFLSYGRSTFLPAHSIYTRINIDTT